MPASRLGLWILLFCVHYAGLGWATWALSGRPGAPPPAWSGRPGEAEALAEYSQAAFRGKVADSAVYQRIQRAPGGFSVAYGFRNFDREELELTVQFAAKDVDASMEEFGFRAADFKALDDWYKKAQEGAIERTKMLYTNGQVTAKSQAELQQKLAEINRRNDGIRKLLDQTLGELGKDYRERRLKLYTQGSFRYKDSRTVEVNIPELVRRNSRRMGGVARAFSKLVEENEYGMEELVGAVTAMAQTAIRYEIPGTTTGDKTISGVLPPPKSFVMGQGDCDTKSALISSILLNWPNLKLVGLAIPEHYLLAVHRIPAKGEVYVDYQGIPYIMIEAAGPAWLAPGTVGEFTENYLNSGAMFGIQPL